jgi:inner membrane protein
MPSLKNNLYVKLAMILVIGLMLVIPTEMIQSLISERESTREKALQEVSSKWSGPQTLTGPILSIPFMRTIREASKKDSTWKITEVKEYLHILPAQLAITGAISPEKRSRGIYEIAVYNSKILINGKFTAPDLKALDIPLDKLQTDKTELVLGLEDLRGIEKQIELNWGDSKTIFNPGVSSQDLVASGVQAKVQWDPRQETEVSFSFELDLKGSQKLFFTPVGKTTDVRIQSKWPNPSFNGAFLPDERTVSDTGFSAHWNILHLNRNFPPAWVGNTVLLNAATFGVDLFVPVDQYQKTYRSAQYALLMIAFTFLVFFFLEALNGKTIHPVQYLLVGFALVVFYTLLLSISEHINFNVAFLISATATLALIGGYVHAILHSIRWSLILVGILALLYGFIFILLQLEEYALLVGSLGIFFLLGLVMFLSRKIDWYQLGKQEVTNVPDLRNGDSDV